MEKIRLHKFMADCGLMSRRAAEDEIRRGTVTVNGVTAKLGDSVVPGRDSVLYKGQPVAQKGRKLYLLLNKPAGVVTTMSDERGRKSVRDLLPEGERVYPVGRLDKDSEGLILCTNDGELANRLMHPSYGLKKTYAVNVRGAVGNEALDRLRSMRELEGESIAPVEVTLLRRDGNSSALRFVLGEGKKRQIRRMCESAGLSVMQLKRVALGPVGIKGLESGKYRALTEGELRSLEKAVGIAAGTATGAAGGTAAGTEAGTAGGAAGGTEAGTRKKGGKNKG